LCAGVKEVWEETNGQTMPEQSRQRILRTRCD
jgi:hypothetical protein